ncbi:MAG: hypothetical protein JXB36_02560, partial [Gammaproteobacteria bacterium]|nr:hypothetical protein [Gammaproteobacteria bacterium]
MSARPQTDEGALHARPRTGEGALYAPPQTGEGTPRARSQTGEGALRERPEGADTVVDPRPAAPAALPEEGRSTAAARRGAILMCPPDYFGVHYSINPWMRPERPPAPELARRQWEALADGFRRSGYEVDVIPPQPGLPDMVFVDAGVVSRGTFVPSNFAFAQRRGEREHFVAWFAARGYRVRDVDPRYAFEGHGDTIWAGDVLYCG